MRTNKNPIFICSNAKGSSNRLFCGGVVDNADTLIPQTLTDSLKTNKIKTSHFQNRSFGKKSKGKK